MFGDSVPLSLAAQFWVSGNHSFLSYGADRKKYRQFSHPDFLPLTQACGGCPPKHFPRTSLGSTQTDWLQQRLETQHL